MQTAPVSFPGIAIAQMCHVIIAFKSTGVAFPEFQKKFVGATGHSQGIGSAIVLACSNSLEEFISKGLEMVKLMAALSHHIQAKTNEALAALSGLTLPKMGRLKIKNPEPEADPTFMMAVIGTPYSNVEKQMVAFNAQLPSPFPLELALVNGPRACVVAGPPKLLARFRKILGQK